MARGTLASAFDDVARVTDSGEAEDSSFSSSARLFVAQKEFPAARRSWTSSVSRCREWYQGRYIPKCTC